MPVTHTATSSSLHPHQWSQRKGSLAAMPVSTARRFSFQAHLWPQQEGFHFQACPWSQHEGFHFQLSKNVALNIAILCVQQPVSVTSWKRPAGQAQVFITPPPSVCVCVCVCERERERGLHQQLHTMISLRIQEALEMGVHLAGPTLWQHIPDHRWEASRRKSLVCLAEPGQEGRKKRKKMHHTMQQSLFCYTTRNVTKHTTKYTQLKALNILTSVLLLPSGLGLSHTSKTFCPTCSVLCKHIPVDAKSIDHTLWGFGAKYYLRCSDWLKVLGQLATLYPL